MKATVLILSALLLGACSFDLSGRKQKMLPTEVVFHGHEFMKLPKEYPFSTQTVNLAPSLASKAWELPLATNPIKNAHFQSGYVFVATENDLLYLIDAADGDIKWIVNAPAHVKFPVGIAKDRLYYSAGDAIVEADLFSGKTLNVQRDLQNVSIPAYGVGYFSQHVLVSSTDGNVQSHLVTGVTGKNWLKKSPQWHVKPRGHVSGELLVIPPHVYYSDAGGNLMRLSALSGDQYPLAFTREGFKPLHAPVAQGDTVYQIFDNSTLYAINRHSMLPDWTYPMGLPKNLKPLLGSKAIAISVSNGVDVLDIKGKKMYHSDRIETPICFDGHNLIGLNADKVLIALDKVGKPLWQTAQNNTIEAATTNAFFVISEDMTNIALFTTGAVKKIADFKNADKIKAKTPTKQ